VSVPTFRSTSEQFSYRLTLDHPETQMLALSKSRRAGSKMLND
jgi:hypothetical protein